MIFAAILAWISGVVVSLFLGDPLPGIAFGSGVSLWMLFLWLRWRRFTRQQQEERDRFRMLGLELRPQESRDTPLLVDEAPGSSDKKESLPPT